MISSRRERKKSRTRDGILNAALKLFAERGFDKTTVAEIAEEADVALSTLFVYFPSKDDLVFHDYTALQVSLRKALDERPEGKPAIDVFRAWIEEQVVSFNNPSHPRHRVIQKLIETDERLLAQQRRRFGYFEEQFAIAVAGEFGDAPDGLRPRIMAGAAIGAMTAAFTYLRKHTGTAARHSAMEHVVQALKAAEQALKRMSATPSKIPRR
ncbi:MAG: TetR family transcriptional regulator [Bryobacterales bacterium]|nr:TetR family transcriptional regulator [Bryobacterales bacterium]